MRRNHTGHRVGQDHHRAKLSDATVRIMREQHASGVGYRKLAQLHSCGISTARDICGYATRPL